MHIIIILFSNNPLSKQSAKTGANIRLIDLILILKSDCTERLAYSSLLTKPNLLTIVPNVSAAYIKASKKNVKRSTGKIYLLWEEMIT